MVLCVFLFVVLPISAFGTVVVAVTVIDVAFTTVRRNPFTDSVCMMRLTLVVCMVPLSEVMQLVGGVMKVIPGARRCPVVLLGDWTRFTCSVLVAWTVLNTVSCVPLLPTLGRSLTFARLTLIVCMKMAGTLVATTAVLSALMLGMLSVLIRPLAGNTVLLFLLLFLLVGLRNLSMILVVGKAMLLSLKLLALRILLVRTGMR